MKKEFFEVDVDYVFKKRKEFGKLCKKDTVLV